jgi:hypothetical protein
MSFQSRQGSFSALDKIGGAGGTSTTHKVRREMGAMLNDMANEGNSSE